MNRLPAAALAILSAVLILAPGPLAVAPAAEDRPNVVFIMIDDLGWMDLACQGNPIVHTPHLDQLARQGMRFTDAYAAAPVCSPTRAAVLTGLSPARLQITNHIPDQKRFLPDDPSLLPAAMRDHLPLDCTTIAERFRQAGYATGFLGKWHLSGRARRGDLGRGDVRFAPEHQGFDLNLGGCAYGGPPSFFAPYQIHNLPDGPPGEYLPDRLATEAATFIRDHADRPFLLCLWPYTVHWPMQAPQRLIEKYAAHTGPGLNDPRYGAMIEAMDAAVGRVLQALDEQNLTARTLVVFTSDNGGFSGVADNRPLRAGKGYLYEGGIRVPLLVRWPKVVAPGSTCAAPVVSMDFYPTLLEAAGLSVDASRPLDGCSLMPLLRGAGQLDRSAIYFHYPNYAWHRSNRLGGAVRAGRYKLIEYFDDGTLELYDLTTDLGETRNLASQSPDRARSLRDRLRHWRTEVAAAMPQPVP